MTKAVKFFLLAAVMLTLCANVWAKESSAGPAGAAQVSSEQREQFFKETESLRQSMREKHWKLRELIAEPNSNAAEIGNLEKEIFQLREQIREKALKAGITCPRGGMGMGYGMGCGMGMGYARGK